MPPGVPRIDPVGLLTLREVRRFIRKPWAWGLAVLFGFLYLLGSLLEGGMLGLAHLSGGYTITIITSNATGAGWWNYPAVIVAAPWGYLELPFFTAVSMLVVAVGVALGMTVAVLLAFRLLRPGVAGAARTKAVGTATGLTPAMIGLVTLGACCSTTAAASAGVGLVAQASGTSVSNLLLNDWYLGLFQVVVVWSALFAQELLLTVYRGLFGPGPAEEARPRPAYAELGSRYLAFGAVRALLVIAGLLWSLAMFVEWTGVAPLSAGPGLWFQWLVQHQLLAVFAVSAGFFPGATVRLLERSRSGLLRALPVFLLVGGLSLLVWLPPVLTTLGLDSLTNQLLGSLGAPTSWGAISPGPIGGPALVARWLLEYVCVGGLAVVASLSPNKVFARVLGASPSRETDAAGVRPFRAGGDPVAAAPAVGIGDAHSPSPRPAPEP